MFFGGPVSPDAVIALARGDGEEDSGWVPLIDDLGTVDLGRDPHASGRASASCACSWATRAGAPASSKPSSTTAPGSSCEALPSDPFATEPDALWQNVLRRQRGRIALFATCPPDPTVN